MLVILCWMLLSFIVKSNLLEFQSKVSVGNNVLQTSPYSEFIIQTSPLPSLPLFTSVSENARIKPTTGGSFILGSSKQHTQAVTTSDSLDMTPDFLYELDALDAYMTNQTQFEEDCQTPELLAYCTHIDYPVPKLLATAPFFQERMAELGVAVTMLNMSTNDIAITKACEKELKEIFCASKFPHCDEFQEMVRWHENDSRCEHKLRKCYSKPGETAYITALCEKLKYNDSKTGKCLLPIPPVQSNLCEHKNVSAWLQHASLEVNSLLRYQFSLNRNLTSECKMELINHLCSFGLQCHSKENITIYKEAIRKSCQDTLKSCQNQVVSTAFKELILNCQLLY